MTEQESQAADGQEVREQSISLFLAIGMVVSALVVGLVVGYIVAPKESGTEVTPTPGIEGAPTAPSLSPDQIEGGQLPSGHPPIPEGQGGESTATTGTDGGGGNSEATETGVP